MHVLTLTLSLLSGAWACETETTNEQLATSLEASIEAFRAFDFDEFDDNVAISLGALPCLNTEITRANAAQLHRTLALQLIASTESDEIPAEAIKFFAAARNAEPATLSFFPDRKPIQAAYDAAAELSEEEVVLLQQPSEGVVKLDGITGLRWNRSIPVVFQILDEDGVATTTSVLRSGDAVPVYPTGHNAKQTFGINAPLAIVAGAVLAGSLVTYGLAYGGRETFDTDTSLTHDQAKQLQGTTNALSVTSSVLLVGGVGIGAAAVVSGTFGGKKK